MPEPHGPAQAPSPSVRPNATGPKLAISGDAVFRIVCQTAASSVILLFGLLLFVIVWKSWESIHYSGLSFLVRSTWDPNHRQFGALAFVFGTVATSIIAMVIAVPLGIGVAVFLAEISPPRLRRIGSFLIEMLAAVPSVVYGFWGLFVL